MSVSNVNTSASEERGQRECMISAGITYTMEVSKCQSSIFEMSKKETNTGQTGTYSTILQLHGDKTLKARNDDFVSNYIIQNFGYKRVLDTGQDILQPGRASASAKQLRRAATALRPKQQRGSSC